MIIATDIDDVLTPGDVFTRFHNDAYGTKLTVANFNNYNLAEIIDISPEEEAERVKAFYKSEHFANAPENPGAKNAIAQ